MHYATLSYVGLLVVAKGAYLIYTVIMNSTIKSKSPAGTGLLIGANDAGKRSFAVFSVTQTATELQDNLMSLCAMPTKEGNYGDNNPNPNQSK